MVSAFLAFVLFAAAPAALQTGPAPAASLVRPAAPPAFGTGLVAGGFGAPLQSRPGLAPLQGLPNASDPAPQCRATCTKNRAVCGDDAACGDQWRQCVVACAAQPR